jgi:hypothetical protein
MHRLLAAFAIAIIAAHCALAKEVVLPVTGSVGVFRSDLRIFNPHQSKNIQIRRTSCQPAMYPTGRATDHHHCR